MKLTQNVYVETGTFPGANVGYICTSDGIVMIESPQRPSDAVKWREEINSRGTVKYLINTEGHGDHFAGNFFFAVPVIAQDKSREMILAANLPQLLERFTAIDPEGSALVKNYRVNAPSITFSERLTLYLGEHSFHLIHHPGHTLGETAVYIPEERVAFAGDNIFFRVQAFFHDADPALWLESLKRLGELDVDYIVPGHGQVCDKSYLEDQASYIQQCVDTVKKAVAQGLSKEETVAKVSLPQRYPFQKGQEVRGPQLLKMSVAHLYDLLSRG